MMTNYNDNIKIYTDINKENVSLLGEIKRYIDIINKFIPYVMTVIEGKNINDFRKTKNNLENIIKYVDSAPNEYFNADSLSLSIDYINEFYENLSNIIAMINELTDIITLPDYLPSYSYSQSASLDIEILHKKINTTIDIINNYKYESLMTLIKELNKQDCVEFLLKSSYNNIFTNNLLSYLLAHGTSSDKLRLGRIIETRKDLILDSKRINLKGDSIASLIGVYGTVPVTLMMKFNELMKLVAIVAPEAATLASTIKFCKSIDNKLLGFVIISRGFKSSVEFDIRGLISSDFVSNLDSKPNSGLNKKFIKRFSTVTRHYTDSRDVSYEVIINPNSTKVLLIETFDGAKYRLISSKLGEYTVSTDFAYKFLSVSTRPDKYNTIMSNIIMKNCIDASALGLINNFSDTSEIVKSSSAIKDRIIKEYLELFDQKSPTTLSEFKQLFSPKDMSRFLIPILLHITTNNPTQDVLLTYLTKCDDIANAFNEALDETYESINIPETLFESLSKKDLQAQLREITVQIITAASDKLDQGGRWTSHNMTLKEYFIEKKYESV
jgi:hypothetical protein